MYRLITACRICGNRDLRPILNLGEQYLTGVFPRTRDVKLTCGPLELVKCHADGDDHCGLVQLRQSYDLKEMYGENYGYRSSLNRSMVEHLRSKSAFLMDLVGLRGGDLILDIGSNDGTLLSFYPEQGHTLVGMDPSAVKFMRYYKPHIQVVPDFFSADAFRANFGKRKARLVTSIAMFYDLEQPMDFMRQVRDILADDGVWHLEQSYLPLMLSQNAYDAVCHEHLECYALRQIQWMADRCDLKILDISFNDINGGSFAITLTHAGSSRQPRNPEAIRRCADAERDAGLEGLAPYERFHQFVFTHREQLLAKLAAIRGEGKKVLGYGASTKGNVILQFCNLTEREIPCIAEVNEDKFGCFAPGSGIPIVSEADARRMKPDYFLVLPWAFRENLIKREGEFLRNGGKMIFPLPHIEVVSG